MLGVGHHTPSRWTHWLDSVATSVGVFIRSPRPAMTGSPTVFRWLAQEPARPLPTKPPEVNRANLTTLARRPIARSGGRGQRLRREDLWCQPKVTPFRRESRFTAGIN